MPIRAVVFEIVPALTAARFVDRCTALASEDDVQNGDRRGMTPPEHLAAAEELVDSIDGGLIERLPT